MIPTASAQLEPGSVRAVVFDLDDTLAPSKSAMDRVMAEGLRGLLEVTEVCIISGGRFEQFESQVLRHLEASEATLAKLHLMPTCGTRYLRRQDHNWTQQYAEDLTSQEKAQIVSVLEKCARDLGFWEERVWGERIEDRGSQVTFSALGQEAPLDQKAAWDPTGEKRRELRARAAADLPSLEVRGGGSTSIDVTRRGIDKAYGIRKLCELPGLTLENLLFIGDRLDEAGNDYPVLKLGVRCLHVVDWTETLRLVLELTDWLDQARDALSVELVQTTDVRTLSSTQGAF